MELTGGKFEAEPEVMEKVTGALLKAGEWSVEFAFSVGREFDFEPHFQLGKVNGPGEESSLSIQVRPKVINVEFYNQTQKFALSDLRPHVLHHLALVYKGTTTPSLYLDGVQLENPGLEPALTKVRGEGATLTMRSLNGPSVRMDQVAIYNRALDPDEVKAHFELNVERTKQYRYREPVRVTAKLVEMTPSLPESRIQPYAAALAVYTYEVLEQTGGALESGELKIGERINVAHWTYLDRKMLNLDHPRALEVGETYNLLLEHFEDHPYLKSQRRNDGDVDVLLPFFYDVKVPPPGVFPREDQF
jgi:hypothetical protein